MSYNPRNREITRIKCAAMRADSLEQYAAARGTQSATEDLEGTISSDLVNYIVSVATSAILDAKTFFSHVPDEAYRELQQLLDDNSIKEQVISHLSSFAPEVDEEAPAYEQPLKAYYAALTKVDDMRAELARTEKEVDQMRRDLLTEYPEIDLSEEDEV